LAKTATFTNSMALEMTIDTCYYQFWVCATKQQKAGSQAFMSLAQIHTDWQTKKAMPRPYAINLYT